MLGYAEASSIISKSRTMSTLNRRNLLSLSAGAAALAASSSPASADHHESSVITPPADKPLLIATKLGMIDKEANGKQLTLAERLTMAKDAGFDGTKKSNRRPERGNMSEEKLLTKLSDLQNIFRERDERSGRIVKQTSTLPRGVVLPAGWESARSPSGRTYFFHRSSGKTDDLR